MIPQETIDRILQSAQIVDIIGEFVALKKKGVNYVGNCPFHSEKTASFIVSPVKGICKCFGCGKGGNVIYFIQEHEGFNYPEAIKWLGKKVNIEVEQVEQTPEEKALADHREQLRILHEWGASYFQKNLQDPDAKKYLKTRNVNSEIIEKFRLGFALNTWNSLIETARKAGYKDPLIIDASLIGKNEKNVFDWFRNRIMFPFLDLSGNVIGFTGRILEATEKDSKYQNSRDTELFKKGKALFGLFQSKRAIIQEDECYLVEGNFDVTSFHQAKIENTVCGSGTALTVDQIRLIRRFTNNITIIYDGDPAGIKASFKNIDLMLAEGINVHAIALPAGEDPDSFAQKNTPKKLADYLEKQRKDFITFKYEILKAEIEADPLKKTSIIKELLLSISIIPDPITRNMYKRMCTAKFNIDERVVDDSLRKLPHKELDQESLKIGWIGLDWATDEIRDSDQVNITSDINEMYKKWEDGQDNTISYKGDLSFSHIQELNALTHNVLILDEIKRIYKDDKVIPEIEFCKKLYEFNFSIKIVVTDEELWDKSETISFIEKYFYLAQTHISEFCYDQDRISRTIEESAQLLSHSDNTTLHIYSKKFAEKLNLKEADFRKIMKPYLDKKKSRFTINNEVFDDSENLRLDPDRLPDYVDQTFYQRWRYFPLQNGRGEKVRYVFQNDSGNGLQIIANFYMEPLFHIKDPDPTRNKRVIKINNAEQTRSYYVEMNSSAMIDFAQFKKVLFNEGGNIFTRGKAQHHETILASIAKDFPECYELNVFGQQHEGFWAFTNSIFADGKLVYMDDLGLATYKDITYYSPAFSKIFSGLRKDNDKYEIDRFFIYRENDNTTFEEWAKLMDDVYKLNSNGKWAILFSIMAAFRSIIYPIDRLFTTLFFTGPTDSGKSQIAISIRSLYMKLETPLFNLNSGSDAAFFTTLERYRDVPIIFEEYNDNMITDTKFQGLKAAVYDGEGKQKRKDAASKELDISKINGAPLILGQEIPEKDDGSLGNRCILCHVPKKNDWNETESLWFRLLKDKEKSGLTHVLLDILKNRDIVSNNYQKIQRAVFKQLKDDFLNNGQLYETRVLNTVSLFLAMCKLLEVHVPSLKLPFTYKEFYELAKAKIIAQSEAINNTNRVSTFFDTIELLLNRPNGIRPNKEYKIERMKTLTIMKNRTETDIKVYDKETKILFMRINILHQMYCDIRKNESLKLNNLMNYLKDHPSYIGTVKSTRFAWSEIVEQFDDVEKRVLKVQKEASSNTSAVAFNYELLQDIIDLEKYGDGNSQVVSPVQVDYTDDPTQHKIDFDDKEGGVDALPF